MNKTFLTLSFILIQISVFAQTPETNFEKYWYYRDRLKWFVMPGYNNGQSIVSNVRNRDAASNPDGDIGWCSGDETYYYSSISFGQEWTQMGMYIGMLATEYKLLKDNEQFDDANNTLAELNKALFALLRLDRCENEAPWFETEVVDGFFIREDAPTVMSNEMEEYFNQGLEQPANIIDYLSSGYYGKPAWIDPNKVESTRKFEDPQNYFYPSFRRNYLGDFPEPTITEFDNKESTYYHYYKNQKFTSQDEVLGVLIGLTLTAKLVDDQETFLRARYIASRIISNFANCENCGYPDNWMICFPDGAGLGNNNGGDGRAIAVKFKNIMDLIADAQDYSSPLSEWCENEIHNAPNYHPAYNAALSYVLYFGDRSNRNLFSRALSMGDGATATFGKITLLSKNEEWDVMFHLLWGILYDKNISSMNYNFDLLKTDLDAAFCGGSYCYSSGHYSDYWATDNKWSADYAGQHGGEATNPESKKWCFGNFPGLDYMLLYNLACLSFQSGFHSVGGNYNFPYYVNYNNRSVFDLYYPDLIIQQHNVTHPGGNGGPIHETYHSASAKGNLSNPEEIRAISTITTNMVVGSGYQVPSTVPHGITLPSNEAGDVIMKAGESIKLTDGFRVDAGAHFLARIESYSCGGLSYKNMVAPPWSENYRGCYYDTLISVPMDQRAAIVYSEDNYEEEDFDMPLWEDYFYTYDTTITPELAVGAWLNPNPCGSSATLTVVSENEQQLTIELYDMTGIKRETFFNDIADQNLVLDLNLGSYASGTYMLRITGSGGVKVLRFVKE